MALRFFEGFLPLKKWVQFLLASKDFLIIYQVYAWHEACNVVCFIPACAGPASLAIFFHISLCYNPMMMHAALESTHLTFRDLDHLQDKISRSYILYINII